MPVYWITGKKGAGKTTYARRLAEELKAGGEQPVVLDGDAVREHFPAGYTDEERHEHIIRIARFAALLESEGHTPIIALVSPRKDWRQEARTYFKESYLVYLPGGTLWKGTTYEVPDREELNPPTTKLVNVIPHDPPNPEAYSMLIGRYQPFHDGHAALVRHLVAEGKNVLIVVRNGDVDEKNPYTYLERVEQIHLMLKDIPEDSYFIIPIPDINEVCFGRKVGWGIRQIELNAEVESISGTKIREGEKAI